MKSRLRYTLLTLFAIPGCGSNSTASSTPALSAAQQAIIGNWQVTNSTCNATSVAYVQTGVTLTYNFSGYTLTQTKTSAGCTQNTSMPYTFDGTTMTVSAGSSLQITCSPSPCTGANLASSSSCGASGSVTQTATNVVSISGLTLTGTENDTQASQICQGFASTAPFVLTYAKH